MPFRLLDFLKRQAAFSEKTFGPGERTQAVLAHIAKELEEIRLEPWDTVEWIDVVLLTFDGARRAGHSLEHMVAQWPIGGTEDLAASLGDLARVLEGLEPPTGDPLAILPRLEMGKALVEREPDNASAWMRLAVWALEGARRTNRTPAQVLEQLEEKFARNQARDWPDWRMVPAGKPMEHVRRPGVN